MTGDNEILDYSRTEEIRFLDTRCWGLLNPDKVYKAHDNWTRKNKNTCTTTYYIDMPADDQTVPVRAQLDRFEGKNGVQYVLGFEDLATLLDSSTHEPLKRLGESVFGK